MSLEDWLDKMVMAENMIKIRSKGFVYLNPKNYGVAKDIAASIGIDLDDWVNRYFDDEVYS